jgi:D-threo-aldose 1-dehydrogenase
MKGTFPFSVDEADAIATVQHALERGITLLDTAPYYANGQSEVRVGRAIKGIPRDQYRISTKVGWLPHADMLGEHGGGTRSYARENVLRSIDASLHRLGIDHIDIAHVHDPESGDHRDVILREAYPTLVDLKRQGVIGAIGAGLNQTEYLADYVVHAPLDCAILAGRYTLLEQAPAHTVFPEAQRMGIAILAAGVFNSGILVTGAVPGARYQYANAPEPILRLTRMLEAVCARHGVPLPAAALQFAAAQPAIHTLVLGMVTPRAVDENLANLVMPIPPTFWAALRERGLIDEGVPTPSV